ncbi:MAG TPA: alpha/beta hydrolase [Chryseosolibacter sp.]|nr:alpha/beta hydrolase [Chryseosolibacter sp.]
MNVVIDSEVIARNAVRVFGNGHIPMMFAHGFGCDQNMWRFITPAFENDYKLVLFDYVGAGKSDLRAYHVSRYSNLNGYVQDVLDICKALALRDVVFVGHSVSAMIGALAAIKEPSYFSKLIMVGPSPCYINHPDGYFGGFEKKDVEELLETMDRNYIGWANFLAPAIMKNPDKPELVSELTESFCSTDPLIARKFAEATFFADNRHDLVKVQTPSLIMQCSEDIIAPYQVGEFLHRHLRKSTLRVLQATGHCPHMSAPEETIQVIKEYLASYSDISQN